jgi:hypothetical protein
MLACINGFAQPSTAAYDFRAIVQSGTVIGGQMLGNCVSLESPVLNDLGDVAFTAYCDSRGRWFTSHRIVATTGEHIDGKLIQSLFSGPIAIDNHGRVLYEAFFSDTGNDTLESWHEGLFLDRHLVSIVTYDAADKPYSYGLTDDGRIIAEIDSPQITQPKTHSVEKGKPISCPGDRGSASHSHPSRPTAPEVTAALFPLASNRCGQFLIPVELSPSEPLLLLASPAKR